MIKKSILFISLCAGCIILFASCASKPAPTSESDLPSPVTPPIEAVAQPDTSAEDAARNTALLADVEKARQEAIDAGAETYFPDGLAQADLDFDELKAEAERDPASGSVFDKGADLVIRYKELAKNAADARAAELAALERELQQERTAALQAKARADGIKAAVTEKDAYEEAVASLSRGDSNRDSGDIDAALADYQSARETFDAVFARVSKRREQAAEAMRLATLRAQESENFALEADAIELPPEEDELSGEVEQ